MIFLRLLLSYSVFVFFILVYTSCCCGFHVLVILYIMLIVVIMLVAIIMLYSYFLPLLLGMIIISPPTLTVRQAIAVSGVDSRKNLFVILVPR